MPFRKTPGNYSNNLVKLSGEERKTFVSGLKSILGFKPSNISIYEKALIHKSASLTLDNGRIINNERLEFLGDAILDAILSELLFEKFPDADEGDLTKIRARIVNRNTLNSVALSMKIDKLLVSHINKNNAGKNIYGDAFEAILGSVFLDKGYSKTKKFIVTKVIGTHINLDKAVKTEIDYKSQVFQWAQKLNRQISFNHSEDYEPKSKTHIFSTTLLIDHEVFGEGSGKSKKVAEQKASLKALTKIRKVGFID